MARGLGVKVEVEIDCRAEEAWQFFGLAEFRCANEAVMGGSESSLDAAMKSMDPETLLAKWMPAGASGWGSFKRVTHGDGEQERLPAARG